MRQAVTAWTRVGSAARALAGRPVVVVGATVLLAAALSAYFSRQIVGFDPDEIGYTHLAIGIAHSLSPFTSSYGGGQRLNQLYPLLISPLWGSLGNVSAFRATHIWNALMLASAAIPTYLLAREVVDRRWAGYLAALLVALSPWATLALTELTEIAAFPACTWALLAMQRSLARPSVRRDVIALVAIAVASYARLQLILLAPVLVLAMFAHELGWVLATRTDRRERWMQARRRIVREHRVLSFCAAVGVLAGVPLLVSGRLANVFGFYHSALTGATLNSATFDLARSYLVFIAIGVAAVPAALTIGFVADAIIAPTSRRVHAFAVLSALTVVALTIQVAEISVRFNEGVLQERYLFYIAPLFAVGMCAALLSTQHPLRVAAGGGLVLALLIATTHYESARSAFWYQASPAMTGLYDWIRPLFGAAGGPTANPGSARLVAVAIVVLAFSLLVGLCARRVSATRLLAAVAVAVAVVAGAQTVNALWRVVHGNSSGRGFGRGSLARVDWVDKSVPSGASVEQLDANVEGLDTTRGLWEESTFWNRSIAGAYTFGGVSDYYYATPELRVSGRSGAITLADAGARSGVDAPYLVTAARGFPIAIAGSVLSRSPDGRLELLRIAVPMRAAWNISGVSSDGWLAVQRPATMRVYMLRGEPRRCLTFRFGLALSAVSSSARAVTLAGRGLNTTIALAPGQSRTASAEVCGEAAAVPELRLRDVQAVTASDPQVTPQLTYVAVA